MTHDHRLRRAAASLLVTVAALAGTSAAHALSYRMERILIPFGVSSLETYGTGGSPVLLLRDTEGNAFRIGYGTAGLYLVEAAVPAPSRAPAAGDGLPDGRVAAGSRDIAAAWLTEPTARYGHGALGDRIEAGGLAVRFADGREARLSLGEDAVFEDLQPRLVNMDGDGRDEVLVVKSYLARGAALAVVSARDGQLRIVAESRPLGAPNRWLNPVGTGDFDGDQRIEIAAVTTPHIGGTLRTYEMHAGRLVEERAVPGFSNHAYGSRQLGLSAVVDVTRDGIPDLAVPSADRRTLKVVTLAGGRYRTVAAIDQAAAIATDIAIQDLDDNGRPDMVFGLENRFLIVILWDE